jgi:anti-sigma factor (TIGR02949 family)
MADESIHTHADELACIEVVELVTDYLEGALSEADARRLERHFDTCPGCAEYLRQLRTIAGSLRGLTDESFPGEMRDRLIAEFRDLHNG